jgi:hypothetical protein
MKESNFLLIKKVKKLRKKKLKNLNYKIGKKFHFLSNNHKLENQNLYKMMYIFMIWYLMK